MIDDVVEIDSEEWKEKAEDAVLAFHQKTISSQKKHPKKNCQCNIKNCQCSKVGCHVKKDN